MKYRVFELSVRSLHIARPVLDLQQKLARISIADKTLSECTHIVTGDWHPKI
jgi:hypothetical protein